MATRTKQQRRPLLARLGETLDGVMFALSPERGGRRIAARHMFERLHLRARREDPQNSGGGFKGADNDRLYAHRWLMGRLSADSRLELDHEDLRLRSREIYVGHSAGGAVDSRTNNVVGCGFKPQAKIKPIAGVFTQAQADTVNEQLETLFARVQCKLDVDRQRSLWDDTRLVDRHFQVDGEGLAVLSDVGGADEEIPLAIEVVDPDRLETPPEHAGNPLVRMGVERNRKKRIVAYWIRKTHPDDTKEVNLEYERVPAERVCHVYERWFAGQSRGLPCFTRVLSDLRNAADMEEASIIAAQMEACDAVFVTTKQGAGRAAVGNGTETNSRGQRLKTFEPGSVNYVDDGSQVTHTAPQKTSGTFAPWMQWCYRRIAAGTNMIYEFFAKDWSGVSFAGGRLSLTEARLDAQARQKFLIDLFLSRVWERFVEEAVILGVVDIDARLFNARRGHFCEHAWIPPAFPYAINPQQEIDADVTAVDNNLDTLQNRLAMRGLDISEVYEQREWERQQQRDRQIEPPDVAASAATPTAGDETGEPSSDAEASLKEQMDAYGAAVRSGSITPQIEDEEHFRAAAGLPPLSAAAREAWEQDRVRRPITLVQPGVAAPASPGAADDDDSEPAASEEEEQPAAA